MVKYPLQELARNHARSLQKLHQIWNGGNQHWKPDFVLSDEGGQELDQPYTVLAHAALKFGETFLALDISKAGISALENLGQHRNSAVQDALIRLNHVQALALARLGSVAEAQAILERLTQEDQTSEILAAMARTFKDLSFLSADQESQKRYLARSHQIYFESYRSEPGHFTGINTAATALWLGDIPLARSLAGEVRALCESDLRSDPGDVWSSASLAEALLIQGCLDDAARQYRATREAMAGRHGWGDIATMRKQALIHCEHMRVDPKLLDDALRLTLVTFSGHMIDAPGRTPPRFPTSAEEDVRGRIREELNRLEPAFGFSAAACGGDILFLEEMQRRGSETVVFLPWRKEDFLKSSVCITPDGDWESRFHEVLNNASSVVYLSQQTEPPRTEIGFEYLVDCVNGMTILHADSLHADVVPMALWDGASDGGPGGTRDFVEFWRGRSCEPVVIRPMADLQEDGLSGPVVETPCPGDDAMRDTRQQHRHVGTRGEDCSRQRVARDERERSSQSAVATGGTRRRSAVATGGSAETSSSSGQQCIKTMLFADVVGYSSVLERLVAEFVTYFLGSLARLIAEDDDRPVYMNTWGDAAFLVFDSAPQGGRFALKMLQETVAIPWRQLGFPVDLNVRIGLHTGPVLQCLDPVTNQLNFFGAHVCHVARIEPVARPGEVLATEAFAAYARISDGWEAGMTGFSLNYLGLVDFHKKYGTHPLFRVISGPVAAPRCLPG